MAMYSQLEHARRSESRLHPRRIGEGRLSSVSSVIFKHGLRNAMIPILTLYSQAFLPAMLGRQHID